MVRYLAYVALLSTLVSSATYARSDRLSRAKTLFRQAETKFGLGQFQEALKLYRQAYEAKPLPGFHFNIGQCLRNLGQYQKAIFHFKQYLARSRNASHQEITRKLITECEHKIAERGRDREGAHIGDAKPKGPGGETKIAPKASASSRLPETSKRQRKGLNPVYFWSMVGLTGALLTTGIVTGALALSKSSDYNDPQTPIADRLGLKDSGESLTTASTVTFALAAAAAAGTAALYFFTGFGAERGSTPVISAAPPPGGGLFVMGTVGF